MENWIMMLMNKVKKIMSKQTEHDGRFDAIDAALGNASVQGVLDKIGETGDTGGSTTAGTVMAKENLTLEILNQIFNGLGGENGISLVPNYTILHGTFSGSSSSNPIVIEGKGFISVTEFITGSTSSSTVCYLEVDGNILLDRTTQFYRPLGNKIPFKNKVILYSTLSSQNYLALLEE